MAQRTIGTRSLIGRALSANRRTDTRSSVFPSHAAQSGLTNHTAFLDSRNRARAPSPRSCARRRLVSTPYPRAAGADLASDPLRARPNARKNAGLASVTHHHSPTRASVSALVRSDLLQLSPVNARQSGEISAPDSKIAIPRQTTPCSAFVRPLSLASADFRSPSQWLCPPGSSPSENVRSPVHERSPEREKQALEIKGGWTSEMPIRAVSV